jgi:hypothetical protein
MQNNEIKTMWRETIIGLLEVHMYYARGESY